MTNDYWMTDPHAAEWREVRSILGIEEEHNGYYYSSDYAIREALIAAGWVVKHSVARKGEPYTWTDDDGNEQTDPNEWTEDFYVVRPELLDLYEQNQKLLIEQQHMKAKAKAMGEVFLMRQKAAELAAKVEEEGA